MPSATSQSERALASSKAGGAHGLWQADRFDGVSRPWRGIASGGFLRKPVERRGVVDIVPERQFDQIESQRGRAIPRLRRDSVGAPGDVGEQTRMGLPHAQEIIA